MRGANTPMRRMLSGFLAASMVASVCATMSFAASDVFTFSLSNLELGAKIETIGAPKPVIDNMATATSALTVNLEAVNVDIAFANGGSTLVTIPLDVEIRQNVTFAAVAAGGTADSATTGRVQFASPEEIKKWLVGQRFSGVNINGRLYSGSFQRAANSSDVQIVFNDEMPTGATGANLELVYTTDLNTTGIEPKDATNQSVPYKWSIDGGNYSVAGTIHATGTGSDLSDVETTGMFDRMSLKDVIICDGDGRPVPMTEHAGGVDKDLNGADGVQSGTTVYFMINDSVVPTFADDTFWKLKVTKGDNSKMVKAISDTTKTFSAMYDAYYGNRITGIDFSKRHRFIKVELNEIYTDDEYKITLDARLSPKTKAVEKLGINDDSEIKVKDFSFYMKNIVKAADNDWRVGVQGLMLNPLENDWNEVTYFDEDGDVAFMKFFADSDVGKFYAKLSTKWEHADYASYFNDQDAYIFQFTGSPSLSSTSRADLQIYNPFLDDDGNSKIDPETATIYQVVDGDLFDVTDNFTYEEGNNGDMAYCTRTRFLGTYIICEKPVEEAAGDGDVVDLVPDDNLTPDSNAGAPVDVTPGNNGGNGGKAPANTGKF